MDSFAINVGYKPILMRSFVIDVDLWPFGLQPPRQQAHLLPLLGGEDHLLVNQLD